MSNWQRLSQGIDCPLCAPRPDFSDSVFLVRKLQACTLYLARDQTYRGACRVIFDPRHVNRIDELQPHEWHALADDLWAASRALTRLTGCDHMNLASLGNEVPHLHWHLIPRYTDDGQWGAPIWRVASADPPPRRLPESQYAALAAALREQLQGLHEPPPGAA